MSFDISKLASYTLPGDGKEFALKAVQSAPTAALLFKSKNASFGVKGKQAIRKVSQSVTILDGAVCARTGGSDVSLDQGYITTVPLKVETDLCPKQLWNTLFSSSLQAGQAPEEDFVPEFINTLINDRVANIAAGNEILTWQGDTSLAAGSNKRMDGIIKQLTGTSYTTSATSATSITAVGASMVEKLQMVYTSCTPTVRSQDDFYIFVGQDTFDSYAIALAAKNIYKPVSDMTVFGTTAKIVIASGLNGLNRVVAGRLYDLEAATDGASDSETASIYYSKETNLVYLDIHYAYGVSVIWPQQFVFASV